MSTEPDWEHSLLTVVTSDRPGLLARLGLLFVELGLSVQRAHITTLGERVEDMFQIAKVPEPDNAKRICAAIQERLDTAHGAPGARGGYPSHEKAARGGHPSHEKAARGGNPSHEKAARGGNPSHEKAARGGHPSQEQGAQGEVPSQEQAGRPSRETAAYADQPKRDRRRRNG